MTPHLDTLQSAITANRADMGFGANLPPSLEELNSVITAAAADDVEGEELFTQAFPGYWHCQAVGLVHRAARDYVLKNAIHTPPLLPRTRTRMRTTAVQ